VILLQSGLAPLHNPESPTGVAFSRLQSNDAFRGLVEEDCNTFVLCRDGTNQGK
jgi:hypothetical protein